MTYAQNNGHHNIDWQYFLDHPPQTEAGWKLAEIASFGFTQSPGGCLPVVFDRKESGELWDPILCSLDHDFHLAIVDKNIGTAKECLKRLNRRADQLLQTKTQTA